jgi:transcriptional regulator with XRE-family HTH domain
VPRQRGARDWSYRPEVTDSAHARKIEFAAFVRHALDDARATRAWTGTEVSRRTGVSRQTINRWVRGDWASDPEAERVVAFCEGLGLNPAAAFALGWDRPPRPTAPGTPRWT